jgi:enoyl-CoA hydratase
MKEMILTCRHYTANELLSVGMLNQIVTQEQLLPTASELAQSLANKNSNAVTVSKATVNTVSLNQVVLRPDLLLTRG